MANCYCVYIITNSRHTVLYIGVTSNLLLRISQHKIGVVSPFSKKYNLSQLVYYEVLDDINRAIGREKQLKAGSRQKKINIITKFNLDWKDLYNSIV